MNLIFPAFRYKIISSQHELKLYTLNLFLHILKQANKYFRISFVLSFTFLSANGQTYSIKKFFSEEGFTGGTPYIISQDHNGYLWCGTSNGLYKFDGKRFWEFSVNDGLPSNTIYDIKETKDGHLLIATPAGYCEYYRGVFKIFKLDTLKKAYPAMSIAILKDNKIIISAGARGLFYKADTILRPYKTALDSFLRRPETDFLKYCRTVKATDDGTLYAGSLTALYKLKNGVATQIEGLPCGFECQIDKDGNIFTAFRKVYEFTKSGKIDSFPFNTNVLTTSSSGQVLTTANNKVYEYKLDRFIELPIAEKDMPSFGYPNRMMEDKENNIWIAAERGLIRIKKLPFSKTIKTPAEKSVEQSLEYLLVQTNPEFKVSAIKRIVQKFGELIPKLENIYSYILISENEFFLSSDRGITYYNNGKIQESGLWMKSGGIPYRHAKKCFDGSFWFAGNLGTLIYKDGAFHKPGELYKIDELNFEFNTGIWNMQTDQYQRPWLMNAKNYAYWNGREFVKQKFTEDANKPDGMYKDAGNHFLFSFPRTGIYSIGFNADSTTRIEKKYLGLPTAVRIIPDQKNNIWHFSKDQLKIFRSNNGGIPREENPIVTTTQDQMRDLLVDTFAMITFQPNKDSITLVGSDYIYRIDIDKFFNTDQHPLIPCFLEKIDLALAPVDWEKLGYNTNIDGIPQNLKINFNQKPIRFFFKGIFLSNSENIQYQFMLKGTDDTWQSITVENYASYTNLPAGNYTFCVRTINNVGKAGPVLKYDFTVLPPWWATWWFMIIMILLILFIIILTIHLRVNHLKRYNKTLEKLISKRTKNLEEKNIQLARSNERNKLLVTVIAHDIKGPLRFITEVSEQLSEHWDLYNEQIRKEANDDIKKSSKSLLNFLTNFLSWLSLKKGDNHEFKTIAIEPLFNEIFRYHIDTGNVNQNTFSISVSKNLKIKGNVKIIEIIINNLVDNACKYTVNGKITLSAEKTNNIVTLTCSDTGKGMSESQINSINQITEFEKPDYQSSFKMGYIFITDLLKLIKGKLFISSKLGEGTTVKIEFSEP